MEERDKSKNLLDLKHQTNLNYFNIISIALITAFVTIVFGTSRSLDIPTIISLIILFVLALFLTWLVFNDNLKKIKEDIEKL